MDAPLGGDDGLLVVHPDVTGLLRLAHEVADCRILGQFEVEVGFHAAVVGVGRHGVPGAARSQFGHAHLQLAAGSDLVDQQTVDGTFVALLEGAHVHDDGVLLGNLLAGIFLVGGSGVEVELGGVLRIEALEDDVSVAPADVECFLEFQLVAV